MPGYISVMFGWSWTEVSVLAVRYLDKPQWRGVTAYNRFEINRKLTTSRVSIIKIRQGELKL